MPLQNIPDAKKDIPQDRVYQKFTIDRPGKIIFVGHHLSTRTSVRCLIRNISLFGADLEVSRFLPVPKNFFLEILGIRDEIGATLIRREQENVVIGFNMLIDPTFLHHVVRLSFEV
ncbi:hypothetical protein NAC44_06430 [Allorhizobium sp. BGMRC 0089]|uniref:hypothetical protein n=1 Tax=Allorhizobium sonneratiae TaxID=2934936 RepID=UPI002033A50C|nr:hypothetical protein [Allorhizobium sonneratiae]MCM2291965.1 hypothetical protein [Allorhizobium sonneratiae]